ncbi:hypothetical protein [Phenylobacterium montanum]|uniref:Uncharacterized protein n=1 Tax=Phenylobacterium montanum TaxID=2823693 RepID=A0A975G194_9CAUL|nr:hypothetical protein [Caulobacter sp. S6]QUD89255.1 hypothetical protein KCG34_05075 [Caulobacter sp. S6]
MTEAVHESWRQQIARLNGRLEGANDILRIWTGAMEGLLKGPFEHADGEHSWKMLTAALASAEDRTISLLDELSIELELLTRRHRTGNTEKP